MTTSSMLVPAETQNERQMLSLRMIPGSQKWRTDTAVSSDEDAGICSGCLVLASGTAGLKKNSSEPELVPLHTSTSVPRSASLTRLKCRSCSQS